MIGRCVATVCAVALMVSLAAGCSTSAARDSTRGSGTDSAAGSAPSVGQSYFPVGHRADLPPLTGRTLAGRPYALSATRGHVVVINVWASWCAPCRDESPVLAGLSAALASEGVRFVGIDERDVDADGRAFAATAHLAYPQLSDPAGELLGRLTPLPSLGIPSTLVVDSAGRMAGRIIGPSQRAELAELIARVAADH